MVLVLKERELGCDRAIALLGRKQITCLRGAATWGVRILCPTCERCNVK